MSLTKFSKSCVLALGLSLTTIDPNVFAMGLAKKIADQDQFKDPEITSEAWNTAKAKNEDFAKLSAEDQRNRLWSEIEGSKYKELPIDEPEQMNSLHMLRSVEHVKKVFSKDIAPYPPTGWVKHTHMRAAVAKVKLNITNKDSKHTGLFKTGGIGLARLSRIKMGESMTSFAPNLSLQMHLDQQRPVSFLAMCSVDGQGEGNLNFFLNPFTNAPGPANENPAALINGRFFKAARQLEEEHKGTQLTDSTIKDFFALPLTEHASLENTGQAVAKPVAPFEAVFIAPKAVVEAYEKALSENKKTDFREILAQTFKPGDTLYNLYVRDEASSKKIWKKRWENKGTSAKLYKTGKVIEDLNTLTLLGEVVLESGFVASEVGDAMRPRHPL